MSTEWLRKTNTGRVVYERRRHAFSQSDVERINRNFIEAEETTEPTFMSVLVKLLFWYYQRLFPREGRILVFTVQTVFRWITGGRVLDLGPGARGERARAALAIPTAPVSWEDSLRQLRAELSSMVEWINQFLQDKEGVPNE